MRRVSYVTGANSMKFGYQGGFQNPSQTYTYNREVFVVRARNGVMNQLTQTAAWPGSVSTSATCSRLRCMRRISGRPAG